MKTEQIQLNIPLNFNQVVDIVRQLSPAEKWQLSEVLWSEQNIEDIEIAEEHKQIVRERIVKYNNNPESYLTWDEIENKLTSRK